MLSVNKQVNLDKTLFTLSGTIDDADDVGKLVGFSTGPTTINCKAITRINSVGIKNWIKHFSEFTTKNPQLVFEALAPALVEQVNIVKNFITASIASISMPYKCAKCSTALVAIVKIEDLKKMGTAIPATKCPKCSGDAEFDDVPEEYLGFLSK